MTHNQLPPEHLKNALESIEMALKGIKENTKARAKLQPIIKKIDAVTDELSIIEQELEILLKDWE